MKIVSWGGGRMGSFAFGCVRCVVSNIKIPVYLKFIGFYQVFLSAD